MKRALSAENSEEVPAQTPAKRRSSLGVLSGYRAGTRLVLVVLATSCFVGYVIFALALCQPVQQVSLSSVVNVTFTLGDFVRSGDFDTKKLVVVAPRYSTSPDSTCWAEVTRRGAVASYCTSDIDKVLLVFEDVRVDASRGVLWGLARHDTSYNIPGSVYVLRREGEKWRIAVVVPHGRYGVRRVEGWRLDVTPEGTLVLLLSVGEEQDLDWLVTAIDPEKGTVLWEHRLSEYGWQPPAEDFKEETFLLRKLAAVAVYRDTVLAAFVRDGNVTVVTFSADGTLLNKSVYEVPGSADLFVLRDGLGYESTIGLIAASKELVNVSVYRPEIGRFELVSRAELPEGCSYEWTNSVNIVVRTGNGFVVALACKTKTGEDAYLMGENGSLVRLCTSNFIDSAGLTAVLDGLLVVGLRVGVTAPVYVLKAPIAPIEIVREGVLSVKCTPNCTVYLGGKVLGHSPLEKTLRAGNYTLKLKYERYTHKLRVTLAPGERKEIEFVWPVLTVKCSPSCTVKVDRRNVGRAPLSVVLSPGSHMVEAALGEEIQYQPVKLKPGEKKELRFTWYPLRVTCSPGCSISIDGRNVGQTSVYTYVAPGPHVVRACLAFLCETREVTVSSAGARLEISLWWATGALVAPLIVLTVVVVIVIRRTLLKRE